MGGGYRTRQLRDNDDTSIETFAQFVLTIQVDYYFESREEYDAEIWGILEDHKLPDDERWYRLRDVSFGFSPNVTSLDHIFDLWPDEYESPIVSIPSKIVGQNIKSMKYGFNRIVFDDSYSRSVWTELYMPNLENIDYLCDLGIISLDFPKYSININMFDGCGKINSAIEAFNYLGTALKNGPLVPTSIKDPWKYFNYAHIRYALYRKYYDIYPSMAQGFYAKFKMTPMIKKQALLDGYYGYERDSFGVLPNDRVAFDGTGTITKIYTHVYPLPTDYTILRIEDCTESTMNNAPETVHLFYSLNGVNYWLELIKSFSSNGIIEYIADNYGIGNEGGWEFWHPSLDTEIDIYICQPSLYPYYETKRRGLRSRPIKRNSL